MTALTATAGEAKEDAAEEVKLESEMEHRQPANAINFAGELNLPFQSLVGLGARIENARQTGDPVELAAAAQYLAVAEQVAGKQAPLTAEALMDEAVELVTWRGIAEELKAVAALVGDDRSDELQQLAQRAATEAEEAEAALAAGEETRHLHGTLCVRNRSNQFVTVFADGRRVREVAPNCHGMFHGVRAHHCLRGRGCFGWSWTRMVDFHATRYHWTLLP